MRSAENPCLSYVSRGAAAGADSGFDATTPLSRLCGPASPVRMNWSRTAVEAGDAIRAHVCVH